MPTYLWHVSYTTDGVKGLMKEGGSKRRATVQQLLEGLGGRLEAFYYAFGESDLYVIAELPDAATAAAVSMTVNATGAAQLRTTVLLTPEEIDAATQKSVGYRPPGA
ncbi:MAG TPA: GYD domain-containing protein [Chthonomonadales bacterium]|nr:GYD domain-containing protein [Chthonomonadales bacterium]